MYLYIILPNIKILYKQSYVFEIVLLTYIFPVYVAISLFLKKQASL